MTDVDDVWRAIGELRTGIEELRESAGLTEHVGPGGAEEAAEINRKIAEPEPAPALTDDFRDALDGSELAKRRMARRARFRELKSQRDRIERDAELLLEAHENPVAANLGLVTLAITNLAETLAEVLNP